MWRPAADCGLDFSDVWLREPWTRARSVLRRSDGLILSRDGRSAILVEDIMDVALPLYEGRMIDHFDFSAKGWVSGKGRGAVWHDISWENKILEPQYLVGMQSLRESRKGNLGPKLAYMRIGSATNWRTCVATFLEFLPAGDSVFFYVPTERRTRDTILCAGVLATLAFDFQARNRVGGLNLSEFVMNETAVLPRERVQAVAEGLIEQAAALSIGSPMWAHIWSELGLSHSRSWHRLAALTESERARVSAIFEAIVCASFGLEISDFARILRDCDQPAEKVGSDDFTRALDPKGFWRVDKKRDPELRHTVLSLVAFHDLQRMGLEAFLAQNDGEGWMLPETLSLADYGLGHDDRAHAPQLVASRLGPRFHSWQLEGTVEESWEECRRHAANLRAIRAVGAPAAPPPGENTTVAAPLTTDLLGHPIERDLLGQEVTARPRRRSKGQ
jgi:hypothetical protein